jgi:hypothetical protein
VTDAGAQELRHWMVDVEPGGALRNDALLRGVLPRSEPSRARAYLEWADEVAQARTEKLEKFEAEIDWTQGGTHYGRLALEWGLRFSADAA